MENKYLSFAKEIAIQAGKIMKKYDSEDNGASYKTDLTIVTKADKEINDYLVKRVKEEFPKHCVDGEEGGYGKSKYVWVCDPVHGTAMYARHIPTSVFSLALVVDGQPQVGVVYDVWKDSLYSAVKGDGAYRNGQKISVSDIDFGDKRGVGNYDMWPNAPYNIYEAVEELNKSIYLVSIGSVIRACMAVAGGDFSFAIFPGTTHKNCDIAAAKVIVEETGGRVTDFNGEEQRYDCDINGAIISNKVVNKKLLETIKNYAKKRD